MSLTPDSYGTIYKTIISQAPAPVSMVSDAMTTERAGPLSALQDFRSPTHGWWEPSDGNAGTLTTDQLIVNGSTNNAIGIQLNNNTTPGMGGSLIVFNEYTNVDSNSVAIGSAFGVPIPILGPTSNAEPCVQVYTKVTEGNGAIATHRLILGDNGNGWPLPPYGTSPTQWANISGDASGNIFINATSLSLNGSPIGTSAKYYNVINQVANVTTIPADDSIAVSAAIPAEPNHTYRVSCSLSMNNNDVTGSVGSWIIAQGTGISSYLIIGKNSILNEQVQATTYSCVFKAPSNPGNSFTMVGYTNSPTDPTLINYDAAVPAWLVEDLGIVPT